MLLEQLQCLGRGSSRQNRKSLPGENHRTQGAGNLLIIHAKDYRVRHGRRSCHGLGNFERFRGRIDAVRSSQASVRQEDLKAGDVLTGSCEGS